MPAVLNLALILPNILWLVFGLGFIFFILATIVLAYHWIRYGKSLTILIGAGVYLFGALAIIITVFNSLQAYLRTI